MTLATKRSSPVQTLTSLERACLCARTAADQKARDILILDMRGITRLYDFFVLITGGSRRQIHTITEEIDAAMRACGDCVCPSRGMRPVNGWSRIMATWSSMSLTRRPKYYALEELWADAPHVDWENEV